MLTRNNLLAFLNLKIKFLMEGNNNNLVIYQADDGMTKIDVKIEDETLWLSQQHMADLYDTTK